MTDTLIVTIIFIIAIICFFIIGFINGMLVEQNRNSEIRKFEELCINEIFYYSDSNYKKCDDLKIRPEGIIN